MYILQTGRILVGLTSLLMLLLPAAVVFVIICGKTGLLDGNSGGNRIRISNS